MKSLASHVRNVLQSAPETGPVEKLNRGSVLFRQGQEASDLFLIESGLVKLVLTSHSGGLFILSILGPNQLAGLQALIQAPSTFLTDAFCLTDVVGYRVPLTAAKRIFETPEASRGLLHYVLMRDRELVTRIEMLSLYEVEQRLLYSLAELAQMVRPTADGMNFPIQITQLDLASFIGTTRETTSAMLGILQGRNLLKLGRRLITTVQPKLLIDAANNQLARAKKAD